MFQENNVTSTVNVLHVKKEKIHPAYVSKYNSNREKYILLMIPKAEGRKTKSEGQWHYLAVKNHEHY